MRYFKEMFEKFNNLPSKEKTTIIVSLVFTVIIHLVVLISLSYTNSEEKSFYKKPEFVKARILIKGVKDGKNSYNAKTDKIRTKKKKFLPDKITKKAPKTIKKSKNNTKKEVTKSKDKNVVALGKKKNNDKKAKKEEKNDNVKTENDKELTDEERSKLLLSSLKKINPALPDEKKGDKNGDLGKRKGGKNGVEDGNETDPSKVLAGSLYERRVASRIKAKWKIPVLDENVKKGLLYSIRIFINEDGSFSYTVLKKSGNVFFDDSVVNTLKKISKVEAPASQFAKFYKEKGFVINFFPKL